MATEVTHAEDFAETLVDCLGDNLLRIALFGSRARGTHRFRSDYDLMAIAPFKSSLNHPPRG
ncbi:MAG TPA: nucleotidyltransferase domain-containing protein [Polyangiaceae bacterium]